MKKNLWILAAALCMTACSQNEDIVIEQPVTDSDFESPDGQLVIQLGGVETRIGASTAVTRAPLDKLLDGTTATTNLGIFALATYDATTEAPITEENRAEAWGGAPNYGILLNNIKAAVTPWTGGKTPNGVANQDVQKISLYSTDGATAGAVYYYPMQKKYDYTFYGYAPYQGNQTISATNPEITFATIDGSQDIIWQKSAAEPIPTNSIYLKKDVTNDTRLTGYKAQYIRQLKYHFELNQDAAAKLTDYPWIPNINFEHKLAQLRFSIIPAVDQSTEDQQSVLNMKVKDITIKSHGTVATLNILTGEVTFTNTEPLLMRGVSYDTGSNIVFGDAEADAAGIPVQTFDGNNYTLNGQTNATPWVQGYLMVKPDISEFKMDVTVIVPNAEGTPKELLVSDIPVTAPAPPADSGKTNPLFYAGYYYNVRIGIFATQEVNATATLGTWTSGGDPIDVPID